MKDKKLWWILLAIVFSLIMAVAVAEVVSATEVNDTEDWLVIVPEEKICNFSDEDWLWIPGCKYACERYTVEDNETYYNVTDEEGYDGFKPRYWEDPGNVLHIGYFMREPKAAFVVIALVRKRISRDRVKDVFFGKNVSFGLDETAERYYNAILAIHNEIGYSDNEHPPSGLTLEQTKKIFYIETNEQALFWLSEERNNLTGRLHYYALLGICHKMLCPEDAGSAIAVMKNAEGNTSNIKIHRSAYHLATIAYFHSKELVDQCISNNDDLPTEELEQVEMILERANKPEPLLPEPSPMPTPRPRFDYWQHEP